MGPQGGVAAAAAASSCLLAGSFLQPAAYKLLLAYTSTCVSCVRAYILRVVRTHLLDLDFFLFQGSLTELRTLKKKKKKKAEKEKEEGGKEQFLRRKSVRDDGG